jgi:hypothetical protein
MNDDITGAEQRIGEFALRRIQQGRELIESGERLLRILALCSAPIDEVGDGPVVARTRVEPTEQRGGPPTGG